MDVCFTDYLEVAVVGVEGRPVFAERLLIKGILALHQNYKRLQEELVCSEPNYRI